MGAEKEVLDVEIVEKQVDLSQSDGDKALEIAKLSQGIEIDEATNKRLLRKIDLYICPLMCIVYAVQYMDKTSNSYASIMGLRDDLGMEGNMYAWTGTAFYLGYLVFEIPFSLVLQRFSLAKCTAMFIMLWGFILTMSAVPNNYAGFETLRVLLGAFESAITPAFVLITSQWYRTEEQFMRTSMWFCCNGLGTIVGGAIAYGLVMREEHQGTAIAAWKILFITIGLLTVCLGVIVYFHIPDTPAKAWFLDEQERLMVVERIRSNKQGFGSSKFKKDQLKEVFIDPRTYILLLLVLANQIPNGGLTNFGSIIVASLGYSNEESLLMNTPCGAVEVVGLLIGGYIAQRTQQRMLVGIGSCCCLLILSTSLLAFAPSTKAQLAGYYLYFASPITFVCFLSCISSNCAGHTKKVVTNALFLVAYCVGNLIGPQTFVANQAPHYTGAKIAMVACSCVCLVLLCLMYWINWRENKRRDEKNEVLDMENSEFADLTDFQNPEFRYAL